MPSSVEVYTAVWKTLSPTWQERIPDPGKTSWEQIKLIMNANTFAAAENRNEIYDALVNRIGLTRVIQQTLTNPINRTFQRGAMRYGATVQEIMSDVINAESFEIGKDDVFEKFQHRVESAYYNKMRRDVYPLTIEETHIDRAFINDGALASLEGSIRNQMYNGDSVDESIYMKKTWQDFRYNPDIPLLPGQILKVPDVRKNLLDRNAMDCFLLSVKGRMNDMRFPKRTLNPFGFMRQTSYEDFGLALSSEITLAHNVIDLSRLFNPEYQGFDMPIIPVDSFVVDPDSETTAPMGDVLGILFDRNVFRVYDRLRTMRTHENGRNLYRNYFYHVHQLFMASPFYNCTYLVADPDIIIPANG